MSLSDWSDLALARSLAGGFREMCSDHGVIFDDDDWPFELVIEIETRAAARDKCRDEHTPHPPTETGSVRCAPLRRLAPGARNATHDAKVDRA